MRRMRDKGPIPLTDKSVEQLAAEGRVDPAMIGRETTFHGEQGLQRVVGEGQIDLPTSEDPRRKAQLDAWTDFILKEVPAAHLFRDYPELAGLKDDFAYELRLAIPQIVDKARRNERSDETIQDEILMAAAEIARRFAQENKAAIESAMFGGDRSAAA